MERYHDTAGDPPRRDVAAKASERAALAEQMAAFLERGGSIKEVGHQMREAPEPFVINPLTTPVYNGGVR
ncbi:hypothetical protein ACUS6W_17835 [Pseudomonas aeruginosa]|jgi:hypothetical protein|uniref:hypothetical protein n=1 Tax=Pseudomonas aeruginosa TaxID=287 RepID=UPI0023B26451|nr:hypothetical protein [Pseudomonas aeruginosa]MDE9812406.1 hypothetical protein [Pseudomonas aeruginosa]